MAISNKMSILGTKKAVMAYNGGYYLPSVSDEGILSWTPTVEGMAPIPEVNVRGPQGPQGPQGSDASVTAEAVQAVVPMAWGKERDNEVSSGFGTSIAIGGEAKEFGVGVALGWKAKTNSLYATSLGAMVNTTGMRSIAIAGGTANNYNDCGIVIGSDFIENTSSGNIVHYSRNYGFGSITIGAGANTLNNGDTESSNSVTIGCKASNQGADSVVIGASSSTVGAGSIVIGTAAKTTDNQAVAVGAKATAKTNATAIGYYANADFHSISIGHYAAAKSVGSVSIGNNSVANKHSLSVGSSAKSNANNSIAIGTNAAVSDYGATVIRSTAEDGTYTQLYFSGANTPLANQYYNGEAMMGYVVTDSAGTKLACGTRRLSELFTDNTLTQPASLDENGDWVAPKVFHPSDLDLPNKEPNEPEEYQPLPVYPIVEPEIPEVEEV